VPDAFTYTGEQTDASTGLEYLRARYYDADAGRFLSLDPLGDGYDYAYDNPVRFTDPSGLRPNSACPTLKSRIDGLSGDSKMVEYWRRVWSGVYAQHCGDGLIAPSGPTESANSGGSGNLALPGTPAYRAAISGPFDEGTAPRCAQYDLNCDGRLSRLEIKIFCKRNALSPFCEGELLDKVYECVKLGKCDNGLSPEV
jgi:RHS repeat-associated protein